MSSSADRPRTFTETARRAQIISATITTINEIGYHRASLAEIAQRAGVAKSALVYYFASREALLFSALENAFAGMDTALMAAVAAESEPLDQLRAYARTSLAYVDSHRAEVVAGAEIAVSHRTSDGTPLWLARDENEAQLLESILTAGMNEGVFRRMPPERAVRLVENILESWTTELQLDINAKLDGFDEDIVDAVVEALRTRGTE